MFPMSRKTIPVVVEYTRFGKRVKKQFACQYTAKQFYVKKYSDGKRPKVVLN